MAARVKFLNTMPSSSSTVEAPKAAMVSGCSTSLAVISLILEAYRNSTA